MSLPRDRFAARLAAAPLLADGGMGTLLFSRGIPQRACLDELAVTRPDLVAAIHREYLEAGADLIETLTFGANRIRLDGYGSRTGGAFNRRAAQVAREARDVSGRDAWVGGSIGPLGPPTRELRHPDEATIRAAFREQVDGLLEGGADLLVIETFFDLGHLLLAVDEARRAADVPVIASMTFGEDLVLADGTTPAAAACRPDRGRRRRDRRQLRRRPPRVPRRAGPARGAGGRGARPVDHAQRGPAAAPRGPVRVRGRAAVVRVDGPEPPRRRRAHRRRLLRDDAGPHRGDARGPGYGGPAGEERPRGSITGSPARRRRTAPASPGRLPRGDATHRATARSARRARGRLTGLPAPSRSDGS